MSFNPHISKNAQEVIFSRNVNNVSHPPLTFSNIDVDQIRYQKILEMFLVFKLSFKNHLEILFAKFNRVIATLFKLETGLPRLF